MRVSEKCFWIIVVPDFLLLSDNISPAKSNGGCEHPQFVDATLGDEDRTLVEISILDKVCSIKEINADLVSTLTNSVFDEYYKENSISDSKFRFYAPDGISNYGLSIDISKTSPSMAKYTALQGCSGSDLPAVTFSCPWFNDSNFIYQF